MQKVAVIFIFIINSLTAAKLVGQTIAANRTEPGLKYALFTSQTDVDWAFYGKNYKPIKLTRNQLDTVNSIIKVVSDSLHFLITSTNVNTKIVDTLRHAFQIVSAKNNYGQVYLWINAICEPGKDWQKKLIVVEDCGSCYYRFRINLKTKQYVDIEVDANG